MIEFAEEESSPGSPAWMATFADLMSLLMCFFVLLLSFSEMDAQKYKLVAGSMKNAFGVQIEVLANQNPSGSAELTENMQQEGLVTDLTKREKAELLENLLLETDLTEREKAELLEKLELEPGSTEQEEAELFEQRALETDSTGRGEAELLEDIEMLALETAEDIESLEEKLKDEIQGGFIELDSDFRSITIRIKEKGSFDSGSASLQEEFIPVMVKLQEVLVNIDGKITVEGHTDNIDISTPRFASNWDLSSARALSVGHELLRGDLLNSERFVISGYADTVPFGSNDTVEGRASNRRVEINIQQPISQEVTTSLEELSEDDTDLLEFSTGNASASPSADVVDSLISDTVADLGQ